MVLKMLRELKEDMEKVKKIYEQKVILYNCYNFITVMDFDVFDL